MAEVRRVLRVIEMMGDAEWIEHTLGESIHGQTTFRDAKGEVVGVIKAAVVGVYPDYVDAAYFAALIAERSQDDGETGRGHGHRIDPEQNGSKIAEQAGGQASSASKQPPTPAE